MKCFLSLSFLCLFSVLQLSAQIVNPVTVRTSIHEISADEIELRFDAAITGDWHIYSTNIPSGGPIATTLTMETIQGAQLQGVLTPKSKPISGYDPIFKMTVSYFKQSVQFAQRFKLTAQTYDIAGYLTYGACNDESCLPPTPVEFRFTGKGIPGVSATDKGQETPSTVTTSSTQPQSAITDPLSITPNNVPLNASPQEAISSTPLSQSDSLSLWNPVHLGEITTTQRSLLYLLIGGFIGGLLALLTPCVWPMIPLTLSFFLKRSPSRAIAIRNAWLYGASIVVIYVALGLFITLLFGAGALNALSTSAVVNVFFCLLLVLFAVSFFGAFELTLPSSWTTKMSRKSENAGQYLGLFLMAFVLTLTSFSCTGPIIGFLLVEASSTGSILAPTIGMLGFSLALALPFSLLAFSPGILKKMPKSGSWMNSVKIVLAFIELLFALKFLSVADLAYGWGILDREVFLSIWIVLCALLGLYLLGKLRFPHEDKTEGIGIIRLFLAIATFSFTLYLIPGLWGAPLKAVSAFTPPLYTQGFNLMKADAVEPHFTDYEEGMAYARTHNKPVLLDFTGYGCVNCRKMEATVWTDPEVAKLLTQDYVLISLYVDSREPIPHHQIIENGAPRTLRTIGDKWSYLQRYKFHANAQPFYVIMDGHGNPITAPTNAPAAYYTFSENPTPFLEFLQSHLVQFEASLAQK